MPLPSLLLLVSLAHFVPSVHSGLFGVPSLGYKVLTLDDDFEERSSSKVLSCYYNIPTMYDRPFPVFPEQIPPFLCTHINVAFARVLNSTLVPVADRDLEFYNRTIKLKQKNPQLKVLISVGGYGESSDRDFATMMASNVTRLRFIASAVAFMDTYGFDGLDLDWEFPVANTKDLKGEPKEKLEFTKFFQEFRGHVETLTETGYILTAAVGALKSTVDVAYDIPAIAKYLDYVNLMTYDFHYYAADTPFTGPNSPLTSMSTEYGYLGTMNTQWTAEYWVTKGMPKDKIVLGVPTYGRTYSLVDAKYHGYYDLANGVATVGSNGYVAYAEACDFLAANGTTLIASEETKEPYAFNGRNWITIANEYSTRVKAQLVNSMGFLGVSVYNLNSDDAWQYCNQTTRVFPIVEAAKDVLLRSS